MQIMERRILDVSVLDIKGSITLGEGDEILQDFLNGLIHQGQRKFVLNLEGVPYIDSAGNGELVRSYTTVSRNGGRMVLLNLTKRIEDLLSIQKLLTVYEIFSSERDALLHFEDQQHLEFACPSCRTAMVRCSLGSLHSSHNCRVCRACFGFQKPMLPDPGEEVVVSIDYVQLTTYEQDSVEVRFSRYYGYASLFLPRRFDLFAAEIVEKAWETIPPPRRVEIEVWRVRDATDPALARLSALLKSVTGQDLALCTISPWTNGEIAERVRSSVPVASSESLLERFSSGDIIQQAPAVLVKRVIHSQT